MRTKLTILLIAALAVFLASLDAEAQSQAERRRAILEGIMRTYVEPHLDPEGIMQLQETPPSRDPNAVMRLQETPPSRDPNAVMRLQELPPSRDPNAVMRLQETPPSRDPMAVMRLQETPPSRDPNAVLQLREGWPMWDPNVMRQLMPLLSNEWTEAQPEYYLMPLEGPEEEEPKYYLMPLGVPDDNEPEVRLMPLGVPDDNEPEVEIMPLGRPEPEVEIMPLGRPEPEVEIMPLGRPEPEVHIMPLGSSDENSSEEMESALNSFSGDLDQLTSDIRDEARRYPSLRSILSAAQQLQATIAQLEEQVKENADPASIRETAATADQQWKRLSELLRQLGELDNPTEARLARMARDWAKVQNSLPTPLQLAETQIYYRMLAHSTHLAAFLEDVQLDVADVGTRDELLLAGRSILMESNRIAEAIITGGSDPEMLQRRYARLFQAWGGFASVTQPLAGESMSRNTNRINRLHQELHILFQL